MFGLVWGIYAAVRSVIDGTKDYAYDINSREKSKNDGEKWYIDSKGRTRDIRTGHKLFIGDERVNGELHTVVKDLNTGRILEDCTKRNKREKEYEKARRAKEAYEKEKKRTIELNNINKLRLENNPNMSEHEKHKYSEQKYYCTFLTEPKGNLWLSVAENTRVFEKVFNLHQLDELEIKYPCRDKILDEREKYIYNFYVFMDVDGEFVDFNEEKTFNHHLISKMFTNDDVYDIIKQLNKAYLPGDYEFKYDKKEHIPSYLV